MTQPKLLLRPPDGGDACDDSPGHDLTTAWSAPDRAAEPPGALRARRGSACVGDTCAMGILADLFVADPADAASYEEQMGSELPAGGFEVQQFGGFTSLELEVLWSILEGEEWPERHVLESVGEPAESRWLWRFPAPFLELLLARVPSAELPSLATKWAAIEELSCSPDDIRPVLDGLVSLATSAKRNGRALFLWGSL